MTAALSNTGVFAKFSDRPRRSDTVRSALKVIGHMALLISAVVAVAVTTVASYGSENVLGSLPAVLGGYIVLGFVSLGVLKGTFRFAGWGLVYVAGLSMSMLFGHRSFDGAHFGGLYLVFTGMLAFVAGVLWLQARLNRA